MQYTAEKLKEILDKHLKWLRSEAGGERANLRSANLRSANLRSANLRSANLRYADLISADLSYADLISADLISADLRYANLISADLRSAETKDTILENLNWMIYMGVIPNANGKARAFKMTNAGGEGPYNGGINYTDKKTFEVENLNTNSNDHCGSGINLATLQWCLNNKSQSDYRLFLMEFSTDTDNICVPIATDGKFRVKKCVKIGECDWNGNLIKKGVKKNDISK